MKNLKILINYRNLTKLCLYLWERYVVKKGKTLFSGFSLGLATTFQLVTKRFRRVILSNFMNIKQNLTRYLPPPLLFLISGFGINISIWATAHLPLP